MGRIFAYFPKHFLARRINESWFAKEGISSGVVWLKGFVNKKGQGYALPISLLQVVVQNQLNSSSSYF
jgi:hypothetical protein